MKNKRNYYRVLHVQPEAPPEVIRSSYRTMMQRLKMHPDLGGDSAQASLVNEAYAVLRDADARAAYDQQLNMARQRSTARPTGAVPKDQATPRGPRARTESSARRCGFCNVPHGPTHAIDIDDNCGGCGSPLSPAHSQRIGQDAQRAVQRLERNHGLIFFINGDLERSFEGQSQDVSLNGMQFSTAHRPEVGDVLKLDATICQAVARVANVQSLPGFGRGHWQVGIEFLTLRFVQPSGSFVSVKA